MELEILNKKVLSYCEIPEEISQGTFLDELTCNVYVEYTASKKIGSEKLEPINKLDDWIINNYPELIGETFLIHMDY